MAIKIPKKLQALKNDAVLYAHGRLEKCPALKPLEDWFEIDDGWDELVMSYYSQVIFFKHVAEEYFSNSMLRGYVNIGLKKRVKKSQKLAYARDRLQCEFQKSLQAIHAVRISEDPEAYLACFISEQGQGGWDVTWLGVFTTIEKLTVDLVRDGYFVSLEDIPEEKILSFWSNKRFWQLNK